MSLQIDPVDGELGELLYKTFITPLRSGYIKINGMVLPEYYKGIADRIENLEVHDDDIWICCYPKTGTTWLQEMVWCIVNDLDFEGAKIPLTKRFPFLEFSGLIDAQKLQQHESDEDRKQLVADSVSYVETLPRPRFIKTHLAPNLLPRQLRNGEKNAKIISIARNPKDTCISYYHHCRVIEGFQGTFEEFCTLFLGDTLSCSPFWGTVLGYWKKRIQDNVLFLTFEDMKRDLPSVIQKTATFLGKNLTSDQISELTKHLSFDSMKANPSVNNEDVIERANKARKEGVEGSFIRSGTTEQWKTDMTPELIEKFDSWTRENVKGTFLPL